MEDHADAVAEKDVVREGAVAALVRNDPQAGHEGALEPPVRRPQHKGGPCRQRLGREEQSCEERTTARGNPTHLVADEGGQPVEGGHHRKIDKRVAQRRQRVALEAVGRNPCLPACQGG